MSGQTIVQRGGGGGGGGAPTRTVFDKGNITGSVTINWAQGLVQLATLTGNVTLTFTNPVDGEDHFLIVTQDGTGGRTVSWPGSVDWPGGVTPVANAAAAAVTLYHLVYDGAGYTGHIPGNMSLAAAWSNLTDPTGNLAMSMGGNQSSWTWTNLISTVSGWTLKDTAANVGTGPLLDVQTVSGSTGVPFRATGSGTANGVQVSGAGVLARIGTGSIVANSASESFAFTGDISPSQITSNQNDYNPTGLSTATVLRLSTDASRDLTGIQGGSDGRVLVIHNVGSNNLVLKNDVTSTAANRFLFGADVTLAANQSIALQYDSTSSRWRAMTTGSGGAGETAVDFAIVGFRANDQAWGPGSANQIRIIGFMLDNKTTFSRIIFGVSAADNTAKRYDVGIYSLAGARLANIGATQFAATGIMDEVIDQGTITLNPGRYIYAITGDDNVGAIEVASGIHQNFHSNVAVAESSSGGVLPSTITIGAASYVHNGYYPIFMLR